MVFSSNIFLFLFLPITLACYFLVPKKWAKKRVQNSILLIASLFFYSWGEAHYLFLLLISIIANYSFGILIDISPDIKSFKKHLLFRGRFAAIFWAIIFNILILAYFKYANFIVDNINNIFDLEISNTKIRLPLGISFFTFHAISYLVDIYRYKSRAQRNLFDLALYIAFFPQLIAGPIVRYNFIEKYLGQRRHTFFATARGIRRFMIGLCKKILIANPLGQVADAIFNSPLSEINSGLAWIGLLCYSLQIYFDFSGYCDMAVGLARIFGFKFPENFNYPYISSSIKEFWRRWHMSLSSWFRDYVYIPLGGNRVSLIRQYFNLVIVFFLCGLWHGASWSFVFWGMFHGFFLVFERVKIGQLFLTKLPKLGRNFYTLLVVMIGWVFFRSANLGYAFGFLKTMFFGNNIEQISPKVSLLITSHFYITIFIMALIGSLPLVKNVILKLSRNKSYAIICDLLLFTAFIAALIRLSAATYNPFIYFQF